MGVRGMSKRRRRPTPSAVVAQISGPGDNVLVRGNPKRWRTTPPAAGGIDLISGLGDDVLLRVLELLPDARDLVRTSALSRRWRGLWTRVPALRFASRSSSRLESNASGGAERFVAFVDDALALRSAQTEPAVERLKIISVTVDDNRARGQQQLLVPPPIRAAQRWIWYAARHAVKSFILELRQLPRRYGTQEEKHALMMIPVELPGSAQLETLRLAIEDATLALPATAVFASLTDLSLGSMTIADGDGHLLARLLSSACCPCLQKLRLDDLVLAGAGPTELLIEAATLSELSMVGIKNLQFLELRTPSLRILYTTACYQLEALTFSAPRLEALTVSNELPMQVYFDGDLPYVGSLKLALLSHGHPDYGDINSSSIHLMHCCSSATSLDVCLEIPEIKDQVVDTITGSIPQLPHVTSLTFHVSIWERHSFGAGVAVLLAQCSNLKHLSLHVDTYLLMGKDSKSDFFCKHLDNWTSLDITLPQLEEVEFKGLMGTDCELRFMQFVLTCAMSLQKAAISFNPKCRWLESMRDAFEPKLLGDKMWTACHDNFLSYEWRPCISVNGEHT